MNSNKHSYYNLRDLPCRVLEENDEFLNAEIYKPGHGFVPGPEMEIQFAGIPISKKRFEAMILALVRPAKRR